MFIEQIKARLKAKFPGVNLSQKRIDAIADKLNPKLKEEKEIDEKLDELNDILPFADMAKQDDRVRTLETKLKDTKPNNPNPSNDDIDDDDTQDEKGQGKGKGKSKGKNDDVPEWAKSLVDEVKSLRAEKSQSTIRTTLSEKLKEVPAEFWSKRAMPEKEEDIDSFVQDVQSDYSTFEQGILNKGLGNDRPILGSTNKEGVSTAVQGYIESKTATADNKPASALGGKQF